MFEDGDFAFAHNEYDFANLKIAFEVFRFEDGRAVEHWDNIQPAAGPNPSGRGMTDGSTEISDLDKTEINRGFVRSFAQEVLIERQFDRFERYVVSDLIQHDPEIGDGIAPFRAALEVGAFRYDTLHRVLAEGGFVLCMSEGAKNGVHSGLYNLFRVEDGRIVEHWNTIEAIPPKEHRKNDNGKF